MKVSKFKSQYEFVFVGRDKGSFVENYAYSLGEAEQDGKLLINIEISDNDLDAERVGEVIFDTMRKVFFMDLQMDGYSRFEESLRQVNRALNVLRQDRGSENLGKVSVVIATIVGKELFVSQVGDAEVYLLRKKLVTSISDGLDEDGGKDLFTNIASGELENGDFLIVASTRILRFVTKSDLVRCLSGNFNKTVEEIKETVGREAGEKLGMIVIGVSEVKVDAREMRVEEGLEKDSPKMGHVLKEEYFEVEEKHDKPKDWSLEAKRLLGKGKSVVYNLLSEEVEEGGRKRRGGEKSWNKKKLLGGILGLGVVLVFGVWSLMGKAAEEAKIKEVAVKLEKVKQQIDAASTLQYDKEQAARLLNEAETNAVEVLDSGYSRAKAREYIEKIMEVRDGLDGVVRPKVELVANLKEKRENVDPLGILIQSGIIYGFEYNALYPILAGQLEDPLTIDDMEKVISGTVYDDNESLLFFTEGRKLIEYFKGRIAVLSTLDREFKNGSLIQAYDNRIFILDKEGKKIWRYTRRRDTFDSAQSYISDERLEKGVSLAIDGSVFALLEDGQIIRFYQGNAADFQLKKQPVKGPEKPVRIYTKVGLNEIYVVDESASKVFVYRKEFGAGGQTVAAVYSMQYVFDEVGSIRDVMVDAEKRVYVLTGGGEILRVVN